MWTDGKSNTSTYSLTGIYNNASCKNNYSLCFDKQTATKKAKQVHLLRKMYYISFIILFGNNWIIAWKLFFCDLVLFS